MLAHEYFFPAERKGRRRRTADDGTADDGTADDGTTTHTRTLEDITYVLESVNRAASLSAYGIDKGWTTTSNPFQNGQALPPVMTLHYERVRLRNPNPSRANPITLTLTRTRTLTLTNRNPNVIGL